MTSKYVVFLHHGDQDTYTFVAYKNSLSDAVQMKEKYDEEVSIVIYKYNSIEFYLKEKRELYAFELVVKGKNVTPWRYPHPMNYTFELETNVWVFKCWP